MVARYNTLSTLSTCLALMACSPAPAPTSAQAHADGDRVDGVVTYPASDFHEQAPGRRGGTLRVSAAADAGSFDIHALSHGIPLLLAFSFHWHWLPPSGSDSWRALILPTVALALPVAAVLLLAAAVYVLVNLAVDLTNRWIDPRGAHA